MIYTDELRRWKALAWTVIACLGFWTLSFYSFPQWTFIILAAITGVGLAFAFGDWANRRIRRRREDFEIGETVRRERFQEELNDQARKK